MNPEQNTNEKKISNIIELLSIFDKIEGWADWHCDPEADIEDPSPEDMHAHTNGLIMQACKRGKLILLKSSFSTSTPTENNHQNQ